MPKRSVTLEEALAALPGPVGERTPFGPGDFLFAPAGLEHRFEDVTDDLAVWVLFYRPDGGEAHAA